MDGTGAGEKVGTRHLMNPLATGQKIRELRREDIETTVIGSGKRMFPGHNRFIVWFQNEALQKRELLVSFDSQAVGELLKNEGFAMGNPTWKYFFNEEDFRIFVDVHFSRLLQVRGFLQDQSPRVEFEKGTIPDGKSLFDPGDPRSHEMRAGGSGSGHHHRSLIGNFNVADHPVPGKQTGGGTG